MADLQRHLFGIELAKGAFREWVESRLVVNAGLDRGLDGAGWTRFGTLAVLMLERLPREVRRQAWESVKREYAAAEPWRSGTEPDPWQAGDL